MNGQNNTLSANTSPGKEMKLFIRKKTITGSNVGNMGDKTQEKFPSPEYLVVFLKTLAHERDLEDYKLANIITEWKLKMVSKNRANRGLSCVLLLLLVSKTQTAQKETLYNLLLEYIREGEMLIIAGDYPTDVQIDIAKYAAYFNRIDKRNQVEIQYLKDKSMFKPPIRMTIEQAEEILDRKDLNALPDPQRDFVWIYHPLLLVKDKAYNGLKAAFKGKIVRQGGASVSSKSNASSKKYSFIPESKTSLANQKKLEKGAKKVRDLLDLLDFEENSKAYQFSWLKSGLPPNTDFTLSYADYSKNIKEYKERKLLQRFIQQKLKYLIQEDSPVIAEAENFNNFYHMVQNEIKMNGKEKITRIFNTLLDSNIKLLRQSQIRSVSEKRNSKIDQNILGHLPQAVKEREPERSLHVLPRIR